MSFAQFEKDVQTRFSNNWTATRWTVDGQHGFKPPTNAAWVRLSIVDSDSAQVSMGNNPRFRHFGTIVAQVYVPEGDGSRAARSHADTIAGIFRNKYFGTPVINTKAPSLTVIGENEGWYQVNVLIPFQWDEDF